jgi:hypothetical protein
VQALHTSVLHEGLSPASADHHVEFIRQALNRAVEWDMLEKNPAAKVPYGCRHASVPSRGKILRHSEQVVGPRRACMAEKESSMILSRDRLAICECIDIAASRGLIAASSLVVAAALSGAACPSIAYAQIAEYKGLAEASAAAPLDKHHFVVAEDECNTAAGPIGAARRLQPVAHSTWPDSWARQTRPRTSKAAARVGNLVYWISSHSLTREGKAREWRHRLFAIRVDEATSAAVTGADRNTRIATWLRTWRPIRS